MGKCKLLPEYQLATLYAPKLGTWLISFYSYHPGTQSLERVRKTFNLNRVRCLKERKRVADLHISLINEALQNGYNYFVHTEGVNDDRNRPSIAPANLSTTPPVTIVQALERALKIRMLGVEHRTAGSYKSFVNTFVEWLKNNSMELLPANQLTAAHFQEYIFYKSLELKHGNSNINDTISFFKTTFNTIKKKPLALISENPIAEMDFLTEPESSRFAEITEAELRIIVPALVAYNPHYYLFTKFIACNMMRPHHIARLKASQIQYDNDLIALDTTTTKNKKVTYKQLSPDLKKTLLALGCDKVPGDHYIFSDKHFKPGKTLYNSLSIRAAERWRDVVIGRLGINKKMYALKHTAGTYLINNNENFDVIWLSNQMEHGDLNTTEIYVKHRKVKKVDQAKLNTINY